MRTKCPIRLLPSSDIAGAEARQYNTGIRPNEREPNRCPDCGKPESGRIIRYAKAIAGERPKDLNKFALIGCIIIDKEGIMRLPPDPQRLKVRRNPSPPSSRLALSAFFTRHLALRIPPPHRLAFVMLFFVLRKTDKELHAMTLSIRLEGDDCQSFLACFAY